MIGRRSALYKVVEIVSGERGVGGREGGRRFGGERGFEIRKMYLARPFSRRKNSNLLLFLWKRDCQKLVVIANVMNDRWRSMCSPFLFFSFLFFSLFFFFFFFDSRFSIREKMKFKKRVQSYRHCIQISKIIKDGKVLEIIL